MSIEGIPEINLDVPRDEGLLSAELSGFEAKQESLVSISASVENFERVVATLMALRSSNVAGILYLKKPETPVEDEEMKLLFGYLRDWDQLFLHNFLELCGDWVPVEFQAALRNEAKIELKWAKEWLTANADQRIHRYPGLPWRSFVRKVIGENYNFSVKFLELTALPGTPENMEAMARHLNEFLEAKKKVVCVFPKRWNAKTEH